MLAVAFVAAACGKADAAVNRDQPAADLAKQIAAIAGPGPVKLTFRNRSSLLGDEAAAIRKLLERDLRGYGINPSGADSATALRITLSENNAGGLWVAEVQEGTEVRVAMISVDTGTPAIAQAGAGITLRKTLLWQQKEPVLDLLFVQSASTRRMIVLEPERIASYVMPSGVAGSGAWTKEQEFPIDHSRPFPRDMRGRLLAAAVTGPGHLFDAWLPGALCSGAESGGQLTVSCADNDDPWPIAAPASAFPAVVQSTQQKAFYNETRDDFTGVLAPGFGAAPGAGSQMDLPPFYSAAVLPRASGMAMLFNGIDGKVVLIENNTLKPIAGTRDWGSDLAVIRSACGSGAQVLVSGSGAASADSLRAYEIPGREAEPVSAPLAVEGSVMAIWPSSDGAGATAIVRVSQASSSAAESAQSEEYEVYSVSALCN
jgi:hypothetical protein